MTLNYSVHDEFFERPEEVRRLLLAKPHRDYVSAYDGITYPGINQAVPPLVARYVRAQLEHIVGFRITPVATFSRVTTLALAPAPNKIHCDTGMGAYAALIYMSEEWPEGTGTSFWRHKTEGEAQTANTDLALVQSHTNDLTQWDRVSLVQGSFNRVLTYDSRLWHCAEPIGGWGDSTETGRLVLTCFFNREVTLWR